MIAAMLSGGAVGLALGVLGMIVVFGRLSASIARAEERADARWSSTVREVSAASAGVATETIKTAVFGGEPQAAIAERNDTMQETMQREISEQTIQAGMSQLRDAYRELGVEMTDGALRDEVYMIASGQIQNVVAGTRQ